MPLPQQILNKMAYRSRRTTTTFRRRPMRRRRRYVRAPIRRRYVRRPRRVMSRRRILNISSDKKRDNRLQFSNLSQPAGTLPALANVANSTLTADTAWIFIHTPTALDRSSNNAPEKVSYRTGPEVFMKGYRESVRFNFTNGAAWQWRRICFTMKGDDIRQQVTAANPLWLEDASAGFVRPVTNHQAQSTASVLFDLLFQGTVNLDWQDPTIAKVDNRRVTVKYDRLRVMRGGNGEPRMHDYHDYYPMNSTFIFDDDEGGGSFSQNVYHSNCKRGMGDYYIVDLISCAATAQTVQGTVSMSGTLYWHER